MSTAKRRGIQFTADQIGNAKIVFKNLIGNTATLLGDKYNFENNFIRLRGSTLFHDYDLNKKDPYGISTSEFTTFDSSDIANYVIQGGSIGVSNVLSIFPNSFSWNPFTFSPPTPEGWVIYDYNAWSNYIPQYNSSGIANTSFLIYNPNTEPSSGSGRTTYDYPVRYNGSVYSRVPLFNNARWVSVKNTSGDSSKDEVVITISKDELASSFDINPFTNTPNDLGLYSHSNLISSGISTNITLAGAMGLLGVSDILSALSFSITETDKNASAARQNNYYTIKIKLPTATSWTSNYWFHFVMYWNTHDTFFKTGYPSYSAGNSVIIPNTDNNSNYYIHSVKSFFNKSLNNSTFFDKTSINDSNIYLYNPSNTNHTFEESKYNSITEPFRYKINENIPGSSTGSTNLLSGLVALDKNEICPVLVVEKNSGYYYDNPEVNLELVVGKPIPESFIEEDLKNFNYYPEIPKNYNLIAKIILGFPKERNISLFRNNTAYSQDASIIYIEMVANNSIRDSISDESLSRYFTAPMYRFSDVIRKDSYNKFFNILSQKLISSLARFDMANVRKEDYFKDKSTRNYVALHNLLKMPSDSLIGSTSEPYPIQFSQNSTEVISDYATLPPSTNMAGFASTELYIKNLKISSDTEFEVYLEKYNNISFSNVLTTGNSLEKDYSFQIKFGKNNHQFVIKNLFLNSSKYYLTDSEYQSRIDKKLSVAGYYKNSLLNTILDFKVFSYAGLIPDLKMGSNAIIENRENAPIREDRITESDFEKTLSSVLNKDQINTIKSGFGLTDSFYIVDETKPSQEYGYIEELGITVSNYSLNSDTYWIDNSSVMYGDILLHNVRNPKHYKDIRNDSFVIGLSGYGTADNSLNILENYKDQQILSNSSSVINQSNQLGIQTIRNNKIAIRVSCDITQEVKSFRIKLRKTSDYVNANASIKTYIYSNSSNLPDAILATGSELLLKDIDNYLDSYDFQIRYKFFKNKIYWIVLDISTLPPTYDPYVTGSINVSESAVTGIYNQNKNTYADFSRYLIGSELGIGSTVGTAISNWYSITSIGSSTFMTVASTGQTLNKMPYSIKYNFDIGIQESSATGSSTNLAKYATGTGWTGYEGTAFIEFYTPDYDIYGGFNKNFKYSSSVLPEPNRYREVSGYVVDEYWSYNCKNLSLPGELYIYPRSHNFEKILATGSGTSNTNIVSIGATNFSPKILVGLGVSQNTYISAGTSITNIVYDANNIVYNLHLSSLLLNTFSNQTVGIGTSGYSYVKRANDIYLNLSYYRNGGIATTTITLAKSPTWITKWFKKNRYTSFDLDKTLKSDSITANYNLSFENENVSGQYKYLNGYSIGDFIPNSGLGTTFEFKFTSSYGLKVYVNDAAIPSVDQWKTNSSTGATFIYSITSASDPIKFEVQFNNYTNAAGTGQTLIGYWRQRGTSTWIDFDESFYVDNGAVPVSIGATDIQKLSFMYIGKTLSEINTETLGSPPGDKIVFRSK